MWIVGVILNFRERQELWARGARVTRRLCEVYFCRGLGERKGSLIEGGVTPGCWHSREPWGGLEHARLERGEGRAGLGTDSCSGGGWGWVFSPHSGLGLVTSELSLGHEALVIAGMEAARIIVPGISAQPLVHQLVAIAVTVHLRPIVASLWTSEVSQRSHPRRRIGGAGGHNRRPLVRPVCVFLHVLGQVGLLGVGLAAV